MLISGSSRIAILSYSKLLTKRGRRRKYYILDKIFVRSKVSRFEYLPFQSILPNTNCELLITGLTCDTVGQYACSLKLNYKPNYFF